MGLSAPLNFYHDTRTITDGVIFSGPFTDISVPFVTSLTGVFNYLGTNRLSATFTNPLYGGVQFGGNGRAVGKVLVGTTGASAGAGGTYVNCEDLSNKGLTGAAGLVFGATAVTFDFCACTTSYVLNGQTIVDNCLVSLSGCAIGADSSGAGNNTGTVAIQGSNNGSTWTTLNSSMFGNAGVITYFNFPNNNQFYRFIRLTGASINLSEVELFGTIRFINTL